MTVNLYNIVSNPDHLIQTLPAPIGTYTGSARDPVSVDSPEIVIEAQILTGNYVYIPEFSRYYYITDRNVVRNNLTVLSLISDPLMSFAAQIYTLPVYALRTSKLAQTETDTAGYNADLPDSQIQCVQGTRCRNLYIASMPIQNAVYLVAIG